MVGMVKWREWRTGMVEWQTEMATYVLFTVHTDTDNDTLIFYIIQGWSKSTTERRYPPQIRVNMAKKTLAHYISPYKWNNHGSTRKQTKMDRRSPDSDDVQTVVPQAHRYARTTDSVDWELTELP
jgi:hypothetical protein